MRTLSIACVLILSGCQSNNVLMSSSSATVNVSKLHQLQVGMTQDEVYEIMRYPIKEDQITTQDGRYDIWYYLTKTTILGQSEEVARNLTPLVFKDGIFVGMGHDYYNWLVRKSKAPAAEIPPVREERENIDLEKSLTPETPSSAPAKPSKLPKTTPKAPVAPPTTPSSPVKEQLSPEETPPPKAPAAPASTPTAKPLVPPGPPPIKPPGTNVPGAGKPTSTKPTSAKMRKKNKQSISMSSKPKPATPSVEQPAKEGSEDSSKIKMDEEDRDMLEQEQEENFNDW